MQANYWQERWQLGETGFHQPQVHPWLKEFWPGLLAAPGEGRVFVPLCGKSLDMLWLRQQGHAVIGVELSPIATAEFFDEQQLSPTIRPLDGFIAYESDGLQLLCGDFFDLEPRHLDGVQAVYDRAALVALPQAMQERYVSHLLRVLPQRPPLLLITLEYNAEEMGGPPFSTPEDRVVDLFAGSYRVDRVAAKDILDENPKFRGKGLTRLTEKAFRLLAEPA